MNLLDKYRAKLTAVRQDEERQESQPGLDEEERFRFEERAAIMEFDGKLTREEAEREALNRLRNGHTFRHSVRIPLIEKVKQRPIG